jgi:hypothetical protein
MFTTIAVAASVGFMAGSLAGILAERIRFNRLIKASLVHVPGFPRRVAIIHEREPEPYGDEIDIEMDRRLARLPRR